MKSITELLKQNVVLGDGGYLIELERRGYVDSGSGREKVGTGRGPVRRACGCGFGPMASGGR